MSAESRFALLPTYLVLDTSASMSINGAFDAAFQFLPSLLAQLHKSTVVSDKLRIEVITFDDGAKVVFPLGTQEELEDWLKSKQQSPILPDGDWTKYGDAFRILRSEIERGVQQIRSESYGNEFYKAYRPVVFFITDGNPNDNAADREAAFAQLTEEGFKSRPNIVCVGVGDATLDKLAAYSAGRYQSPTNSYISGNKKLVFVSKDGVAPAAALGAIIPALVQSIIASVGSAQAATALADDENEMEDIFGKDDDDLFDDDLFDVFDQDDD